MSTNIVPVTFNMISEQYEMIKYSSLSIDRTRSEIVQILAGMGAKIVIMEKHFIGKQNMSGRLACEKLQLLSNTLFFI